MLCFYEEMLVWVWRWCGGSRANIESCNGLSGAARIESDMGGVFGVVAITV